MTYITIGAGIGALLSLCWLFRLVYAAGVSEGGAAGVGEATVMTSEQLDRIYEEADQDLVERTRALTAESVAKLNATFDAIFSKPRLVVVKDGEK